MGGVPEEATGKKSCMGSCKGSLKGEVWKEKMGIFFKEKRERSEKRGKKIENREDIEV